MESLNTDQISGENIDHLGLVAGVLKKIQLVKRIDKMLPIAKEKGAKVTMGERVAAMILNALGFVDNRLYMFAEFLSNKPIKRLLGPHLNAESFTDDSLGRCLDQIYEYGPTQFVSDITFKIASQLNLLGKTIHVDTTSLRVYGEYDNLSESETLAPQVTYGFSKEKRSDLKQLILNLAVTNKADLPVFMAAHSGNASDQKILIQATKHIEQCCKKLDNTPSFIYVADSSMYESCIKEESNLLWLSRVPLQRKEAKQFIKDIKNYEWKELEKGGYKIHVKKKVIAGIKQRWVLVFSEQAYNRGKSTVERKKMKEKEKVTKQLHHLSKKTYNCEKDAQKALKELEKLWKYHHIHTVDVQRIDKYENKGRPKQGAQKNTIGYKIKGSLTEDNEKIEAVLAQKGHFILATNQLDKKLLPDEEILSEYKGQQKVERGFAFIKDNTFEVSSVFLKKPSRISALMAIMVLSLFTYSLTQYLLRNALKEKGEFVPNQLKKPIQRPTAKWIFFLFRSVHVVYIEVREHSQELVINLTPLLKRIINYLGEETMAIYDITLPKVD
jgi:transposase